MRKRYKASSTCTLDTLPSIFFNLLVPDLLKIINSSLETGTFPKSLKSAVINPLLKKNNLDTSILSNYRPISNLPFIGKIIEKIVFNQLTSFLTLNNCLDNFQVFMPTTVLKQLSAKVTSDIRLNTYSGKASFLVLLDLSAAFDIVDHTMLLQRLENWVGLTGVVIRWLESYLLDRSSLLKLVTVLQHQHI